MIRGLFTINDRDTFNALCERITCTRLVLRHTAQGICIDGSAYGYDNGIGRNVADAVSDFLSRNA